MPLPDTATSIRGGCNCGAIRYRIDIPELSSRIPHPFNPSSSSSSSPQTRFPFIATCHCNDCRTATASLVGGYICVPASMLSVSCLPSSSSATPLPSTPLPYDGRTFENPPLPEREATGRVLDRSNPTSREQGHGKWQPGMEMLTPTKLSRNSFVRFFHSSQRRTRAFCGRCGTNVSYNIWPMVEGFPDIVDVLLGTVDREDLEGLKPENQLWWDYGVGWIRDMARGLGVPVWRRFRPDELVEVAK